MTYEIRTLSLYVAPKDQPVYSELGTTITIVDEAAGEFVEVSQSGRTDLGKIAISPREWPAVREAIDTAIGNCREQT
jgi:hypothetical protein